MLNSVTGISMPNYCGLKVLIVGTGRCGSSALAAAVSALGVDFGNDLVPGHPRHARYGHFEWKPWKAIGETIQARGRVTAADIDAYRTLLAVAPEGIKDPYLVYALPDLVPYLPRDLRIVVINRRFNETVESRAWKDSLSYSDAIRHQLRLVAALYDGMLSALHLRQMYVDYEQLLSQTSQVARRLVEFIGLKHDEENIERAVGKIDRQYKHFDGTAAVV